MNDLLVKATATPRASDWFGVWAMEQAAATTLLATVIETDWPAHLAAAESRHQVQPKAESGVIMTGGANGKSIAVIPILGTMMKSRSSFGGTSTVQVRRDIRAAANNPEVSGIMLAIDSPGGTVAGTYDLAADIKEARRRKPVFAQISDQGNSAAYWVASQASKVYASSPTTMVGSIGTLLAVTKETGGRVTIFSSGPLKAPGSDGEITDEQKAYLQGLVNGWQSHFGGGVKSGRRLTDAQLEKVSSGATFLAETARELKLIDGVQSQDKTLAELSAMK